MFIQKLEDKRGPLWPIPGLDWQITEKNYLFKTATGGLLFLYDVGDKGKLACGCDGASMKVAIFVWMMMARMLMRSWSISGFPINVGLSLQAPSWTSRTVFIWERVVWQEYEIREYDDRKEGFNTDPAVQAGGLCAIEDCDYTKHRIYLFFQGSFVHGANHLLLDDAVFDNQKRRNGGECRIDPASSGFSSTFTFAIFQLSIHFGCQLV